ncbi:MAG: hypothetical protein H8D97_00755 [Proteobacteria bacterium]|nr:hypothetical protein [Pseudomonadota bacterium]
MRVHPIKADNGFGIFDFMTNCAVFPLEIQDNEISNETLVFTGKSRTSEVNHKLGEMIHSMNNSDGFEVKTNGETTVLNCSKIFKTSPFSDIHQIGNFSGIIKIDFQNEKFYLFEKVDLVVWTWTPKTTDKFEFRKDGRHPQSSHKIFSEFFSGPGFMFSEIFSHESNANIVVEDIKRGIIGNLAMNTFIGETGKKFHRGIKTVQDMVTYIFPYIWQNDEVLRVSMGTNHRYKSVQFVSKLMQNWVSSIDGIEAPIILNMKRGRGRNHEENIKLSITHVQANVQQQRD